MQELKPESVISNGFEFGNHRFIRIYDMNLIPRHLFEQVKEHDINVDLVYTMSDMICSSPFCLIYAVANEEKQVVGVLWVYANPLEDAVWCNVFSLDKGVQMKGGRAKVQEVLIALRDHLGLKKVKTVTTRWKALSRYGWTKAKSTIMEVK